MTTFTLNEALEILPLVKAIAAEIIERRNDRLRALKVKEELEAATSPEGLGMAISELEMEIVGHDEGMAHGRDELERLGLTVLRMLPLTIHFRGRATPQSVVFCWMEGDTGIDHGHLAGEEYGTRRPLLVRRQGDAV